MEKHSSVDLPLSRGFLLKPFNPQALAMAIRRTLTVQAKAASAKAQS
jgi:hypothetical protein